MSIAGFGIVLFLFPLLSWVADSGTLEIRAAPRIKLFAALLALTAESAETDGFHWNETPYSSTLRHRVEPLRAHAVVPLYRRAYERGMRRGWTIWGY